MQTWGKKFWESDAVEMWDVVNNVGLRNNYICSVYAARMMSERKQGLIINISSAGGFRYIFSVPYGIGKAAVDRMAADCAVELKESNVAYVSLWPGAVDTEIMIDAQSKIAEKTTSSFFTVKESPEFTGMAIVHLMQDPKIVKKTGRVHIVAELSSEYGFKDLNGKAVHSMRQLNYLMRHFGYTRLASFVPDWLKLPYWVMALAGSKF